MSDRACNYCNFELMKRHARQDGERLLVVPTDPAVPHYMGGVEVYRFPKSMWTVSQFKKLPMEARKNWWVCWFMTLPNHCCC